MKNTQQAMSRPIEVLYIDDDSSILELTKSFLETEIELTCVTTASDPAEGLSQLHNETFDCIVSDYDLPTHNGLEIFEQVRTEYPNLPFILYTGKGSEEIAAEAINAGVTGYLQKGGPDQIRRLANRINHAAAEYHTRIESERYSTVLHALDYPIYVVNKEAEFEYVNQPFVDLTGYDREKIIGSTPELIKTEEAANTANEMLADIVSSSGPDKQKFRINIQTADNNIVPCYDHMAALPFDEEFRGSVGILRDAPAEQEQREELLRQNERLEEFTSMVSHDLRTPLANARTAAELAKTSDTNNGFSQLEAQLDRMDQMIDDLLTLAHESQKILESEPVDVISLASEAWQPFCRAEDTLKHSVDELVINADSSRLRELLENLMRNAVEHTPSSVTVTVGSLDNGFYISDDGAGIDEKDRDKIFDPGYTTAADGTGFGLLIVKRIADAHGWEVTLTESKSGGARFEFVTAQEVCSSNNTLADQE